MKLKPYVQINLRVPLEVANEAETLLKRYSAKSFADLFKKLIKEKTGEPQTKSPTEPITEVEKIHKILALAQKEGIPYGEAEKLFDGQE